MSALTWSKRKPKAEGEDKNDAAVASAPLALAQEPSDLFSNSQNAIPLFRRPPPRASPGGVYGDATGCCPQVREADQGLLRNDGGGGLTLAERVSMGSRATGGSGVLAPAAAATAVPAASPLYATRNARVVAAAAAGKSRYVP